MLPPGLRPEKDSVLTSLPHQLERSLDILFQQLQSLAVFIVRSSRMWKGSDPHLFAGAVNGSRLFRGENILRSRNLDLIPLDFRKINPELGHITLWHKLLNTVALAIPCWLQKLGEVK